LAKRGFLLRVANARHDEKSKRVYVELRVPDDDGTEMFAIALFSFRTGANLTDRQIEQTMVNKARHLFKHAWDTLDTKTIRKEVGAHFEFDGQPVSHVAAGA
jgi:hypothetical protein